MKAWQFRYDRRVPETDFLSKSTASGFCIAYVVIVSTRFERDVPELNLSCHGNNGRAFIGTKPSEALLRLDLFSVLYLLREHHLHFIFRKFLKLSKRSGNFLDCFRVTPEINNFGH